MADEAKVTITILAKNLAQKELESFRQSLRNLGTEAKALLNNQLLQAVGFGALALQIRNAFKATDELEQSQRTLAATAQITGTNIQELFGIANKLRSEFLLDDDTANQFTETITRLTVQAGLFNETQQAAAAFLELGAARGFTAKETMDALELAFVGVYRGAQRLIGTNVADLFEKQARSMGLTVAQLTENEKAHILVTAAIDAGVTARGSYAAWLQTAAGQQQHFALALNDAQVALGKALNPIRLVAIQGFAFIAGKIRDFIGGLQLLAVEFAGFTSKIDAFGLRIKAFVDDLLADIADKLISALTFGKITEAPFSATLRAWAIQLRKDADAMVAAAREAVAEGKAEIIADFNAPPVATGNEPPAGSSNKPPAAPDIRLVQDMQRSLVELKAAYREGQISALDYAKALNTVRDAAKLALKAGLSPDAVQGMQGVIDQVRSGIEGVANAYFDMIDAQVESDVHFANLSRWVDDFRALSDVGTTTAEMIGEAFVQASLGILESVQSVETLQGAVGVMENAFVDEFAAVALATGNLATAMRQSLAAALKAIAGMKIKENLAKALEATGEFLLFGNAKALAAAAKYTAAAAAWALLGGAAANAIGGSGGAGGGGGTAGGVGRTASENQKLQESTIIIQGGFINTGDPDQLDQLAAAMEQVSGRRVTIKQGTGA